MKLKLLLLISALALGLSHLARAQGPNVFIANSSAHPIPITGTISAATGGAAHQANSQVTATTTAGTLLIARPTRVGCLIRNLDASITVYVGAATVTAANGLPLKPGEYVSVTAQTALQVIAASGTPTVAIFDEYN